MGIYTELAASGFDESLLGISSSPFGVASTFVGLRVPALVPAGAPGPLGRYLFLLATRTVSAPTRLTGIGQLLSIGTTIPRPVAEGTPAEAPLEFDVTTPEFKFLDGNVSWHLVLEPDVPSSFTSPATDTTSFAFQNSRGPALLYNTFGAAALSPTGQPLTYPITLTAYTPPQIYGSWSPLTSSLFTWNDMRFPWQMPPGGPGTVDIPITCYGGPQRVSLYASVLQTTSLPKTIPNVPAALTSSFVVMPEWLFIFNMFDMAGGPFAVNYWRVCGRLVFEDGYTADSGGGGGASSSDASSDIPTTCAIGGS